jgi:predicted NBD/HSP70 family sugar kinase
MTIMATTALPLPESSRAVLRVLASGGAITRPRLGEVLNLSKPTMSAAIAELSALGLVESTGSHKGPMGRTATVYGLGRAAGYAIGVDVGAAQVRAIAQTLDGKTLASIEERIPRQNAAGDQVSALVAGLVQSTVSAVSERQGLLRAVAVALPRVVTSRPLHLNKRRPPEAMVERLRQVLAVPVIIENNVNCASLAELTYGAARGRQTFAYLQVGVRIGMGLVIDGKLFRGFNGAAGEVGRMPFPWSAREHPSREGAEHFLGSQALLERALADWPAAEGAPPASAKELFAAAAAGSAHAHYWVERHAADIGALIAGCIGIIDPGLVVLGGGVGQNPLLLAPVRNTVRELSWTTEIVTSALGENATALGAAHLAANYGLGLILGEATHPTVVLPPLAEGEPARAAL